MSSKRDISQIRKYLNGELDARAMHELERRALDDPFLMDALEGFEHAKVDQQASLDELTDRLRQHTDKKVKRMIPWGPISIAASVLIALTAGLWFFTRNDEPPKQVAAVEAPVVKKNPAPQPSGSAGNTTATDTLKAKDYATNQASSAMKQKAVSSSADAAVAPIIEPPAAADISEYKKADKERTAAAPSLKEIKIASDKNVAADTAGFAAYNKKIKKPVTTDQLVTSKAEGVTITSQPGHAGREEQEAKRLIGVGTNIKQDITQAKIKQRDTSDLNEAVVSSYSSQKKKDASGYMANPGSAKNIVPAQSDQLPQDANGAQRTISGHVNGKDDGLPIVGATVKVIGKNFGVVTDVNGKFILKNVPPNANLVAAYIGYNAQKVQVNNRDTLNIALTPNNTSLSEVVVTGYSTQTGDNPEPVQNTRPADGWKSFKKYIDDKATLPNGKTGKVRLSFTVNGLGDMSDFKIIKSLGKDADQAAIDLVKNGPAWMGNSNKKPQTVKITIKFH